MKTIKDIAEEVGLTAHTIRFYEKEGLVSIPRNDNGIRVFDTTSLDTLKAIVHYRRVGMSLEAIKAVISDFYNHDLSTQLLETTKSELDLQIIELTETRDYLNEKIKIHRHLAELQKEGYSPEERLEAYKLLKERGN